MLPDRPLSCSSLALATTRAPIQSLRGTVQHFFLENQRDTLKSMVQISLAPWGLEVSIVLTHGLCAFFFPQDDSEVPFTEEDYRRRKQHPNFLDHINAEKMVLKFGKNVSLKQQNLLSRKSSPGGSLQCAWSRPFHVLCIYHLSRLPISAFRSHVLTQTAKLQAPSERPCPGPSSGPAP